MAGQTREDLEQNAAAQTCPVSHDFDPFGPGFQADPVRALQEEGVPVFYSEVMGWYVVTRHADIRAVSLDTECFSSSIFTQPMSPLCDAAKAKLDEHGYRPTQPLGSLDEPIHMQRRRKIAEPYQAQQAAAWEPRVRQIQTEYLDRFAERGHADLVAEFFWESPTIIGMEFMGIPEEDIALVKEFASGTMTFIFGRPSEEQQIVTADLMGRHQEYARDLIARLLKDPSGPGLLQHAVRTYLAEPDAFDEHFLVSLAVNTLSASHETTSGSLANALVLLLDHRDSWEQLCADPSLIPTAVEESLRLGPSLTTNRRLCIRDTTIGGIPVPAGAKLLLGVAAGNCDEEIFADPGRYDVARANAKRHLTFGYGPHACLGAPLARLQMRVALELLSQRFPTLRLAPGQELEYVPTASARSPRALLVEWDSN